MQSPVLPFAFAFPFPLTSSQWEEKERVFGLGRKKEKNTEYWGDILPSFLALAIEQKQQEHKERAIERERERCSAGAVAAQGSL